MKAFNVVFSMKRKDRRPFVMATFAMTVDGKITTRNYSPVDFTSREDKLHLLRQRSLGDAVLIGHSTLTRDNVRLSLPQSELREARIARGQTPYPLRVIVSNEGRIDSRLNIFQAHISPILIFSTTRMPRKYRLALVHGAILHLSRGRRVDLAQMLHRLFVEYKVRTIACEGGATLFRSPLGKADQAYICSFECTFCPRCTEQMNAVCSNCGGELVRRPRREERQVME